MSSSGSALFLFALAVAAVNVFVNGPKPPPPIIEPDVPDGTIYIPSLPVVHLPTATTQPRPRLPAAVTLPSRVKPQPIPAPVAQAPVEASEPAGEPVDAAPASEGAGTGGILSTIPYPEGTGIGGGEATGQVQEVSFGDVRIVEQCRMEYPSLAMRARITGEVMVEVTCSTDGRVSDVRWISGNEIFREAVEDCLRSTRYAAQPIPFRFRQPFRFQLR